MSHSPLKKMITLREKNQIDANTFQVELSFDNDTPYIITVNNPFADSQEAALEWYFEEYLSFPFLKQTQFQTIAATIPHYGETLFKQVFADNDAYADYRTEKRIIPWYNPFCAYFSPYTTLKVI